MFSLSQQKYSAQFFTENKCFAKLFTKKKLFVKIFAKIKMSEHFHEKDNCVNIFENMKTFVKI